MPPCAIDFTRRFTTAARALTRDQRQELEAVVGRLATTFGQPHAHSGLGIRRLQDHYFECRLGRDLRVVFKLESNILIMATLGNHDDVRNFIKGI